MEPSDAQFLVSDEGGVAVTDAMALQNGRAELLSGLSTLRKKMGAGEARIAWKAAQMRLHAGDKLGGDAQTLLLDQEGYEMASGAATSQYHARLLSRSGAHHVLDLCGGLGIDTIAFASHGMSVTVYEQDPARAMLLAENVRRAGVSGRVVVVNSDVTVADLPLADAAFFDPARRTTNRRWARGDEQCSPPLSFIERVRENGIVNIAVKLSPGVDRKVSERYSGDLQFLSVKGECKEALLLLGGLKDGSGKSAVLLPEGDTFRSGDRGAFSDKSGSYLWEPNAAVIRAGLTSDFAASVNGWQRDPLNDYVFADCAASSPFGTRYRVLKEIPYTRRALQHALAGSGKLIMKQRGFPQSIEEVLGKLKLTGTAESIVVLGNFLGESYAFVVEKVEQLQRDKATL